MNDRIALLPVAVKIVADASIQSVRIHPQVAHRHCFEEQSIRADVNSSDSHNDIGRIRTRTIRPVPEWTISFFPLRSFLSSGGTADPVSISTCPRQFTLQNCI